MPENNTLDNTEKSQRNQLGVYLDSLENSQINTELFFGFPEKTKRLPYDLCVFYNSVKPLEFRLDCPTMTALHIGKFDGICITTSLDTTNLFLAGNYNTTKVYYYAYNLEWTYNPSLVSLATEIMNNPRIEVIVRCKDHADKIKEDFGKTALMMSSNFNLKGIIEWIAPNEQSQS